MPHTSLRVRATWLKILSTSSCEMGEGRNRGGEGRGEGRGRGRGRESREGRGQGEVRGGVREGGEGRGRRDIHSSAESRMMLRGRKYLMKSLERAVVVAVVQAELRATWYTWLRNTTGPGRGEEETSLNTAVCVALTSEQ